MGNESGQKISAGHRKLPRWHVAIATVCCALMTACTTSQKSQGGWFVLRWMEKPAVNGPSKHTAPQDEVSFSHVLSYESKSGVESFATTVAAIREGDVIAYRMNRWDAYRDIISGKLNKVGYRLFKYGHLAIVTSDLNKPDQLRIFSSESFKGPNVAEDLGTLQQHDFDVYRLNQWERVNHRRLAEFERVAMDKAGNWMGYDFMGMFGIANSNMRPTDPASIGHDYICSTVVVSALYYAGVELDAIQRDGYLDIVTPAQVVDSHGRFIPLPEVSLAVETPSLAVPVTDSECVSAAKSC